MIEDKELRELFRTETTEVLGRLERGLLKLEAAPGEQSLLDDVFREAHSLKGAASMLGIGDLESLAHALEDVLGRARRRDVSLTSAWVDRLTRYLDGMGQYVEQALTGRQPTHGIDSLIAMLEASAEAPGAPLDRVPEPEPEETDDRLHSLRVDPRRLDRLMALAAEIRVAQSRLADQAPLLEQVLAQTGGPMTELAMRLHRGLSEESARLELLASQLDEGVRDLRLVPLAVLFTPFRRMVRDLARQRAQPVELGMTGAELSVDKRIVEEMKAPLMHLLRNAVDHGLESAAERRVAGKPEVATVYLRGFQHGTEVVLEVGDDGRGIDSQAVRRTAAAQGLMAEDDLARLSPEDLLDLIFTPGFSTRAQVGSLSGRGVGLDVVRSHTERLRGTVVVESQPGLGTLFRIRMPMTVLTSNILVVRGGTHLYGLPAASVRAVFTSPRADLFSIEGQPSLTRDQEVVSLFELGHLLGLPSDSTADPLTCVLVEAGRDRLGIVVDQALEVREVVTKPLGRYLTRVRNVFGLAILSGGELCMLLRPTDLVRQAARGAGRPLVRSVAAPVARRQVILLVEDSLVTRVQEKRILEAAGYEVVVAVDGLDAVARLTTRTVDAVVSDVEMPGLDGLGLTHRLRQNARYQELPIILVTSLQSEEDRQRGLEAGANAYITKGAFDQRELLETLRRLL